MRATTTLRVPLPLVPDFVRGVVPSEVVVHGEHLVRLVGGAQPFHGAGERSPGPPAGRTFFE